MADPVANPPAETLSMTHDAFGREVGVVHSVAGVTQRTTTKAYDAFGRMTEITSDEGSIFYGYDAATGALTRSWTGTSSDAVTDTRYSYDDLGRLLTVETHERFDTPLVTPEVTTYFYDSLSRIDAIAQANGIVTDYAYTTRGQVAQLTHFVDADGDAFLDPGELTLTSFAYAYDAAGQRLSAVETYDTDANGTVDVTNTFTWTYDAIDRLLTETYETTDNALAGADYIDTFTYDLNANRVELTRDLGGEGTVDLITTYAYDDNDRLLTETKDHQSDDTQDRHTVYGWDATQQTGKTVHEGLDNTGAITETITQAYSLQGRLSEHTHVASSVTTTTSYEYDHGRGNRYGLKVKQTVVVDGGAPIVTEFLYDPNNPTGYEQIIEQVVDGVMQYAFTLGHDVLTQAKNPAVPGAPTADEILTFLYDAHGSTRQLANALAEIVNAAQTASSTDVKILIYDAYGNAHNFTTATALTTLLYSGEFFDARLQMQYLRARVYDAGVGRFVRLDPFAGRLQNPQSMNKYGYVHASPIGGTDPSGLAEVSLLGATIATGLGAFLTSLSIGAVQKVYLGVEITWQEIFIDSAITGLVAALAGPVAARGGVAILNNLMSLRKSQRLMPIARFAWEMRNHRTEFLATVEAVIATGGAYLQARAKGEQVDADDVLLMFGVNFFIAYSMTSLQVSSTQVGREFEQRARQWSEQFWGQILDDIQAGVGSEWGRFSSMKALRALAVGGLEQNIGVALQSPQFRMFLHAASGVLAVLPSEAPSMGSNLVDAIKESEQ